MLKGLGNIASMMKNAQQMMANAEEMKAKLKEVRVEGTAGADMVKVVASGDQRVVSVTVDEAVFASGDKEMLEDLIASATNSALDQAREAAAAEMTKLTGGMPGMEEALSKFGLGNQ